MQLMRLKARYQENSYGYAKQAIIVNQTQYYEVPKGIHAFKLNKVFWIYFLLRI